MRCDGIARRLLISLLTVLLLVAVTGAIGAVSADPGGDGMPIPSVPPPPNCASSPTGSALLVVSLIIEIECAILL